MNLTPVAYEWNGHGDAQSLLRREWLVTNGMGGYASGTVLGPPSRKYHGLFVPKNNDVAVAITRIANEHLGLKEARREFSNALSAIELFENRDRIARAACIFPLTQRQGLNKSLGTRHRAAIGLTEETDAVVVVVSEETGAISHACKGQLVRGVTSEELRAFLTSMFVVPARSRNWIGWLRSWVTARVKSSPAVVPKPDVPAPTTTSTEIAK